MNSLEIERKGCGREEEWRWWERELIESHTQDTVAKGHSGRFRKKEREKNKEVRITSLELRRKRAEWTYKEKSEREREIGETVQSI